MLHNGEQMLPEIQSVTNCIPERHEAHWLEDEQIQHPEIVQAKGINVEEKLSWIERQDEEKIEFWEKSVK